MHGLAALLRRQTCSSERVSGGDCISPRMLEAQFGGRHSIIFISSGEGAVFRLSIHGCAG